MRIVLRPLLSLLLCLGLLFSLAACSEPGPTPNQIVDSPSPSAAEPVTSDPPVEPSPDSTPSPSDSIPEPTEEVPEPPTPTPSAQPDLPTYIFGTPLAESEVVEDTHFENAAFLGDSRTEGLQLFGGLRYGDFFWARGMTVFRVDDPNYAIFDVDGEKLTMIGALRQKEYDSIYIMVGVNELGYDASTYERGLRTFVELVLEVQPNAVVYLQILPPVNEEVAHQNGLADYINNTRIGLFNEAIVRIAAEQKVVLLDTAEAYRDETGSLPAELASDGCHFNYSGYTPWTNYLRNHVMDAEVYHYNRSLETVPEPEPSEEPDPSVEPEPSEEVEPSVEPEFSADPSVPPAEETEQEDPEP